MPVKGLSVLGGCLWEVLGDFGLSVRSCGRDERVLQGADDEC